MTESFNVDFIGIGAARSGTTWMANVLQHHKDICISKPKELDFFSKRTLFLPTSNNEMDMHWYRSKFTHCKEGQLKGEFSPSYLVDADAPRLIKEAFPDVKLVLSLRNPTDAIISHYQNICTFHPMKWTFEEFLKERSDFLEYYKYAQYIQNYFKYFDPKDVHIILYDDIMTDSESVMRDVLTFIGADASDIPQEVHQKINQSSRTRVPLLRAALSYTKNMLDRNIWVRRLYKKMRIDVMGWKLVRLNSASSEKIQVSPDTRAILTEHFASSVVQLENILQRDLSVWKK